MRIDKIKSENKHNIIDIDVFKFGMVNNKFNVEDENWDINLEKSRSNIKLSTLIIDFSKQNLLAKELKCFFKNQIQVRSDETVMSYFNIFKTFILFIRQENIELNSLYHINYELIEKYTIYLKNKKSAYSKYRDFKNLLNRMSNIKNIKLNPDVYNKNFPNIRLNRNIKNRDHYTEDDFKSFSKTISEIIKDYLNGSNEISQSCFVMSSYWFIAICTGFNETALNSLTSKSFDFIDNNKSIMTIIGEKNRSANGYQVSNISVEENELLIDLIERLKCINKDYAGDSIFIHKAHDCERYYEYKGSAQGIIRNKIYKKYANKNNCNILPSTFKIRNYRSLFLYQKSKNEKMVSEIMNHKNLKTTIKHYMKQNIKSSDFIGIFLVQNLLECFVENKEFNNWIDFQKHFDLKEVSPTIILDNIKNGKYKTPTGNCIKNYNEKEICTNYLNCFKCKHYSVIGDKDLWKLLSFRECLINLDNKEYLWVIDIINNILKSFEREDILVAKNKLKVSRHPFWKNEIMVKQIISDYEKGEVNEQS